MSASGNKITRRDAIATGLAIGATTIGATVRAEVPPTAAGWDHEVDIVCVGSGCAGMTAAVTAVGNGDTAIVLERERRLGGTTAKSGAVHWIPNNPTLKAARGLG